MDFQSKYFEKHLSTAVALIDGYKGVEPFHLYLKKYFRVNRKHGSKDRKQITSLCYNFFRLGSALPSVGDTAERIKTASRMIEKIGKTDLDIADKLIIIEQIFPFGEQLSHNIDPVLFGRSFLIQPLLFLRIRPGNKTSVRDILKNNGIAFRDIDDHAIALENTTRTDNLIRKDEEAVIQDLSSQRIATFFSELDSDYPAGLDVWDACAGSGGKSILAADFLSIKQLMVTDTRKNILSNLRERFAAAGIRNYKSLQADLTQPAAQIPDRSFDLIFADLPCSGSGTWSRTPENLLFFRPEAIRKYALLQRKITENLLPKLRKGGYLLYITCSVFAAENEDNISHFTGPELNLKIIKQGYLKGYEMRADTLFGTLLQKI